MKKKLTIATLIFTITHFVNVYSQISDSLWSDLIVYQEPDNLNPGLLLGNPSRDEEAETIWLSTGLTPSGGIPYDLLYVEDVIYPWNSRIFIYSERKLMTYNVFEPQWDPTIDLSVFGSQTLYKQTQPLLPKSREKHLAYNPDKNELYCLTQDLKILIIDPRDLNVISEIIPDTDIELIDWAIIKYDPVSQYLFLGLCKFYFEPFTAELFAFNTTDYTNEYSITNLSNLNDFSFNPSHQLIYLSSNNEIQVRNSLDGSELNTITMPNHMGVIFNAYNENTGLNKTYCLPKSLSIHSNNALIFNGNNINPLPLSLGKGYFGCGIYNTQSNKVYIGYSHTPSHPSGFISFDANLGYMLDHSLDEFDIIMDMVNIEDRVFISSKDHIYCCRNGTYYPNYSLDSPGRYFYRIEATNYVEPRIWATNLMDQSLQMAYAPSVLNNTEWYEPELVSGAAQNGFFNPVDHKLYLYYGMPDGNHKFMYIYNPASEEIQTVNIYNNPSGVGVDEETNNIYFSTYFNSFIRRYDATNNTWLEPIEFPEEYSYCDEIYLTNGNLYCSVKHLEQGEGGAPSILVYNLATPLANPEIIPIPGFSSDPHLTVSNYTADNAGRVYVCVRFAFTNFGRVIRINEDYTVTDCGINIEAPDEIIFDKQHNKILVRHLQRDKVTILDFEVSPPSSKVFFPREGLDIIDMEIDLATNLVYFDYNDPEENGYIDIYTTEGIFIKTVQVGYRAMALKYNHLNHLMYVNIPVNFSADRREQLWSIDPGTFDVYSLDLGQNEGNWRNGYYLKDLILDDENNIMYSVSAHGNIKVVQCADDQLILQPNIWNWISFPRLDREGNGTYVTEDLLVNIQPPPVQGLELKYRIPQPGQPQYISRVFTGYLWTGDLEFIKSSLGYKLYTANNDISLLPMTGSVLASNTIYDDDLVAFVPNWTGYFLESTQSPFDAIGTEFLDKITWMAGQYWYCHKESNSGEKNSGYWWRCACEQGRIELKFADMIEIFPSEDISGFHWQTAGSPPLHDPKGPSELFSYQEQPEYDAIMIELDTGNLPQEIGAFAGDTCIGATTVHSDDTLALICAYTQGFEGEEITFEMVSPTKTVMQSNDYNVLNTRTGIREKRRIIAGEDQPYFLVSFNLNPGQLQSPEADWIQCRPNPANQEVNVSYWLAKECRVNLELVDAMGRMVMSWNRNWQNAGTYNFSFNTQTLPSGVYQLIIVTGYSSTFDKLIIFH
jgi:DNA-binding beta-propeller fold protein YncE